MKRLLFFICTLLYANVIMADFHFWEGDLGYMITGAGEVAVSDCYGATSVNIPSSVTKTWTHGEWSNYDYIIITDSIVTYTVTSIRGRAFDYCSSLTSVTIPNSVTSIGGGAFYECTSLTSVTIPNSVTSIGNEAFDSCINLNSVTIGNSVTSIGEGAFHYCSSLTSVNIPNSVTSIGVGAFMSCRSLTSVTIPNSVVTSIGDRAFYGCSSLTSMTIDMTYIPNLSNIGLNSTLQNLTLGENVTSIRSGAFNNYFFLQNVTCLATTPPTLEDNTVFPYPNIATLTIPCGTLEAYSAPTSFWNMFFADRIEEDCSGIEQAEETLLSFFPNPTKSEITFSQAIEKVEVIDLTGKAILTFTNAKTINIESLPAGAYYLRLTNEEKTSLQKVIKQ